MDSPWYRFPLQIVGKITLELLPLVEVLDNPVKQVVHPYESESEIAAWLELEILGYTLVHVELQIHPRHTLLEHGFRDGEQDGPASVEFLVLVIGATIRMVVGSIRGQRCPFLVQQSKHYHGFLHEGCVEHVGPWHVELRTHIPIYMYVSEYRKCRMVIRGLIVEWFFFFFFYIVDRGCVYVYICVCMCVYILQANIAFCWKFIWKGSFFHEWYLPGVKCSSWSFHVLKIQIFRGKSGGEEGWYFLILYDVSLRSYVTAGPCIQVAIWVCVKFKSFVSYVDTVQEKTAFIYV